MSDPKMSEKDKAAILDALVNDEVAARDAVPPHAFTAREYIEAMSRRGIVVTMRQANHRLTDSGYKSGYRPRDQNKYYWPA